MKKNIFIMFILFIAISVYSQVPNDNIYGDYKIYSANTPFSRLFISIDGTLYLSQGEKTAPAIYSYYFIDNLLFIGKVGYYYSFEKEEVWVLTLIPAFGEAGYAKVVCKKLGNP